MSVNMDTFQELLLDYEDGNLSFSEKIELRDNLKDLASEVQNNIDNHHVE
jgi:hypothetical protein